MIKTRTKQLGGFVSVGHRSSHSGAQTSMKPFFPPTSQENVNNESCRHEEKMNYKLRFTDSW